MLTINSKNPLGIGFFVLALYLIGNGMPHKNEVYSRVYWTNYLDASPDWIEQAKKRIGIAFKPYIALTDNSFDPTKEVENKAPQDRYTERASSGRAEKLRKHLQNTYNVPAVDAVDILVSVFRYSDENNITPELVLSVIDSESSFRTDAKSSVGARGLMQVLPVWHQEKILLNGGSNELLWNPQFNIKIGTQILREYIVRSRGDMHEALARYNGSLGVNNGYPEKILRGKERYKTFMAEVN